MVDMILWENYKKICFIAPFLAPQWPVYAIVTAWNPASREVGIRRNTRRQSALWRAIAASPTMMALGPLWGSAPDASWRESSLALASSRGEAIGLAARFGQNAIYWVEQGELWLQPVLMKGEPLHLGKIESHWIVRSTA
ncbi:DUF3293 domain-containing protein [Aeromonas salmonicida]|uniref:DUF3293 domain-containing protein n=1 Tax=Aeromonas salmonicida TaxID=645 RepID=UPI00073B657E|nr:DUF3293 domain-containing protein [Aeromonas salmonicida]KTA79387.1 hypothetical protein VO69_18005 [Aeromonas salmonicida]MDE7529142.1 DUF3293 domain-containing protein [Aeromonas salmonicida]MDE7533493.1 DUF3293 domain-containing protein [Aeromonas salmonicida]